MKYSITVICIALIFISVILSGCNQQAAELRGTWEPPESCIHGIVYYDYHKSLTPAYNQEGRLRACSMEVVQ